MESMLTHEQARTELLSMLREKSVFRGNFKLSSGADSNYYVDCKNTTLDARGLWLVAQLMHRAIREEEAARRLQLDSVGGLTMGADPIAIAIGMFSYWKQENPPLQAFIVRKTPKAHGQTKLIEGNFKSGDTVVVIDDVVTRGESTLKAISAVEKEGGKVAFVAVLVDRQEGGRRTIEEKGYSVVSVFTRDELLGQDVKPHQPADCVPA